MHLLILPNLELYLKFLEPEMLLEKQKNEMKRHEAWRVYGALQVDFFFKEFLYLDTIDMACIDTNMTKIFSVQPVYAHMID